MVQLTGENTYPELKIKANAVHAGLSPLLLPLKLTTLLRKVKFFHSLSNN
jgi:hypothetical protein